MKGKAVRCNGQTEHRETAGGASDRQKSRRRVPDRDHKGIRTSD